MAQKVNIVLVDDLDGSEASETVTFGLDGATYEIDLNDAHAAELREALAGYVGNARKTVGRRSTGTAKKATSATPSGINTGEVREWARANGYEVSDRGRVSSEVLKAYQDAN